jgi:hyperosmotically inducible protein
VKDSISKLLAISAMTFSVAVTAQTNGANDSSMNMDSRASDSNATPARTVGRYVDDKTISTKINAEFLADTGLISNGLRVRTYKGVVTLSGHTTSQDQIDVAIEKAHMVDGVKAVRNHIKIVQAN